MRLNITIDAPSPMISYGGGWYPLTSEDAGLVKYDGSTAVGSQVLQSFLTFTFNGTGIWLYGARRINHGNASVSIDNQSMTTFNGIGIPDQFQTLLFGQAGLSSGLHNLTLVNTGSISAPWVDIDYLIYEVDLPAKSTITMVDDTNPNIVYNESSLWAHDLSHPNSFKSSISNTSSTASVGMAFKGTAAALYGSMGPDHGAYTCSIDGVVSTYSGFYPSPLSGQVLCHASGLENGDHTFIAQNKPKSGALMKQFFGVDYFQVWDGGVESGDHVVFPTSSKSSSLPSALIGGFVGSFIVLCLIAGPFFFARRRRKAADRHPKTYDAEAGVSRRFSFPVATLEEPLLPSAPPEAYSEKGRPLRQTLDREQDEVLFGLPLHKSVSRDPGSRSQHDISPTHSSLDAIEPLRVPSGFPPSTPKHVVGSHHSFSSFEAVHDALHAFSQHVRDMPRDTVPTSGATVPRDGNWEAQSRNNAQGTNVMENEGSPSAAFLLPPAYTQEGFSSSALGNEKLG